MMLTDSEREWVIANKHLNLNGCIYVRHCRYTCYEPPYCPVIPTKEDLIDAALFEARVAAKLADLVEYSVKCCHNSCASCFLFETDKCHDEDHLTCKGTILKHARLAVEEEMNNDNS